MEKQQGSLVFSPDDYEALTSMVGIYLVSNAEELSTEDCDVLRQLRTRTFGRLMAREEHLLDNEGIFYEDHKERLVQEITDDPQYHPMNERILESLASLPEHAADAMTIEVPYSELLKSCIRWYSENIVPATEEVTKMLETVHPEVRDEVTQEVESAGMRVTGWAYDLGLRDIEPFGIPDDLTT